MSPPPGPFVDISLFPILKYYWLTGMVPKYCHDLPDIQITDNMDKDTVMDQLKQIEHSGPQLADVVKYMRRVSGMYAPICTGREPKHV